MEGDTREYVELATNTKTPTRPRPGFFNLCLFCRLWSHISVDFVTRLPCSSGKTIILTIIDRFNKIAHFVPLPKLPSDMETDQLLVQHVSCLHGLSIHVVSDTSPQFSSAFWTDFCKLLGAASSLSSGFHPQSNGETEIEEPGHGSSPPLRGVS